MADDAIGSFLDAAFNPPAAEPPPQHDAGPATGAYAGFLNSFDNPAWYDKTIPAEERLGGFLKQKATQNEAWPVLAKQVESIFPGADTKKIEQFYHLEKARDYFKDKEESTSEYVRGRMLPDLGIKSFTETNAFKEARDRFEKGEATQADAALIAKRERQQQRDKAKGAGETALDAAAGLPALAAEIAAGGRALRGVGLVGSIGGKAAPAAEGLAARVLPALGHAAATTAVMPRFYLPGAAENAVEKGGDWSDIKNLGPSAAIGYLNLLVLGQSMKGFGGVEGLLPRTAARTGSGMVAQAVSDAGLGAVGLQSNYGLLKDLINGDSGEAMKKASAQAVAFAAFAVAGGREHKPVLDTYVGALDALAKKGYGKTAAAMRIGSVQQKAQALAEAGEEVADPFKGEVPELRAYGETLVKIIKEKPKEPEVKPVDETAPPEAVKPPEGAPEAPTEPPAQPPEDAREPQNAIPEASPAPAAEIPTEQQPAQDAKPEHPQPSPLDVLKPRERKIIEDRAKQIPLEAIGKELGLTRERVRKIEAASIKKLEKETGQKSVGSFGSQLGKSKATGAGARDEIQSSKAMPDIPREDMTEAEAARFARESRQVARSSAGETSRAASDAAEGIGNAKLPRDFAADLQYHVDKVVESAIKNPDGPDYEIARAMLKELNRYERNPEAVPHEKDVSRAIQQAVREGSRSGQSNRQVRARIADAIRKGRESAQSDTGVEGQAGSDAGKAPEKAKEAGQPADRAAREKEFEKVAAADEVVADIQKHIEEFKDDEIRIHRRKGVSSAAAKRRVEQDLQAGISDGEASESPAPEVRAGESGSVGRVPAGEPVRESGGGPVSVSEPGAGGAAGVDGGGGLLQRVIAAGAEAEKRLAARFGKGIELSTLADPAVIGDLATVVAGRLAKGGYTLAKWSADAVKNFGDEIKPHIEAIWQQAQKMVKGEPTGIKNAETYKQMAAQGSEPSPRGPSTTEVQVRADALKAFEADPAVGKKLVDSLAANPRAATVPELGILSIEAVNRKNARTAAQTKVLEAKTPAEIGQASFEVAAARDAYTEIANVAKLAGTPAGAQLRFRQLMFHDDFSLAEMERGREVARKMSGREVTKETKKADAKEIEDRDKKIRELEAELEKVRDTPKSELAQKRQKFNREEFDKALADLKAMNLFAGGAVAKVIPDVLRLARAAVKMKVESFMEFADEVKSSTGKELTPEQTEMLTNAWDAAHKKQGLKTPEERAQSRLDALKDKLDRGEPLTTPREKRVMTPEEFKIQSEIQRLKDEATERDLRIQAEKAPWGHQLLATFGKWYVGSVLSSPIVFGKLTGAAALRLVQFPIQNSVGGAVGKVLPKLAEKAVYEGYSSLDLVARSYAEAFSRLGEDFNAMRKTGKMDIDVMFGDKKADLHPSFVDFIKRMHGAMKTVPKRAAFYRAQEMGSKNAAKIGLDPTDPAVQLRIGKEAYEYANRAIFMTDNMASRKIGKVFAFETDPKTGETTHTSAVMNAAGKFLFPVVRIPTNITAEVFNHMLGGPIAALRVGHALARGMEKLRPEQADAIMRQLKQGSTGMAMLALGYFLKDDIGGFYDPHDKRAKDDVQFGELQIFGRRLPTWMVHNPFIECLQVGATIRRAADHISGGAREGEGMGIFKGIMGVAEEVPYAREMFEFAKLREGRWSEVLGGKARSLIVPQAAQWAAGNIDKEKPFNPWEDPRKVTASGSKGLDRVWREIKRGVPGLRNQLPAAK